MLVDDPALLRPRPASARPSLAWMDSGLQPPSLVLFVGPAARPGRGLADLLSSAGLRCVAVADVPTAHEACANLQFDALVIDAGSLAPSLALGLAGLQPVAACPMLVVATQASEVDEIVSLEHGAAGYLAPPRSPRLLRAHLMALLRLRQAEPAWHANSGATPSAPLAPSAHFEIDPMLRELHCGGPSVALTEGQFAILQCLASPPGRVVPRAELEARARGRDGQLTSRSIDVYVHRLRRRLMEAGIDAVDIECVRSRGYRLRTRQASTRPLS